MGEDLIWTSVENFFHVRKDNLIEKQNEFNIPIQLRYFKFKFAIKNVKNSNEFLPSDPSSSETGWVPRLDWSGARAAVGNKKKII